MVVKVYVSGISASKEVKKRQQRVLLILDSAQVNYEQIDITEPGREELKDQVQPKWKVRNGNPLPPQIFSDEEYLGDYDDFSSAVDLNDLLTFLRIEDQRVEIPYQPTLTAENEHNKEVITNGNEKEEESLKKDHTVLDDPEVENQELIEEIQINNVLDHDDSVLVKELEDIVDERNTEDVVEVVPPQESEKQEQKQEEESEEEEDEDDQEEN